MEIGIELFKAILWGIVEGITEWLPISSTGHMILADEIIRLNVSPEFKEMFLVVIQLGAIAAVLVLYWQKLFPFATKRGKLQIKKETISLWTKVIVAVLPAAIIGIPFEDKINEIFFNYQTVAITLIFYGILFIWLENKNQTRVFNIYNFEQFTYCSAFLVGMFQVLSLIPGTSRSGATILGAMLIGCSRGVAAEFSFFLAVPVMLGASILKLAKFGFSFTSLEILILLVGMLVAFIVSILAIKFLVGYVKNNDFKAFGYYRIVLGIIVILYFLLWS